VDLSFVGTDLGLHKLFEFGHYLHVHLLKVVPLKADQVDLFLELFLLDALVSQLLSHRGEFSYVAFDFDLNLVFHPGQQVVLQFFDLSIKYSLLILLNQPQLLRLFFKLLLQLSIYALQLIILVLKDGDLLV
jgi:hypothetical protein